MYHISPRELDKITKRDIEGLLLIESLEAKKYEEENPRKPTNFGLRKF